MDLTLSTGIYDDAGRYLAPAPVLLSARPDGPWTTHRGAAPLVTVCAWCPGFNPTDPANAGVSHGICAACVAVLEQELAS